MLTFYDLIGVDGDPRPKKSKRGRWATREDCERLKKERDLYKFEAERQAKLVTALTKDYEWQQDLAVVANRPALARFLFELSQLVSSNSLANEPLGVVVGLVGKEQIEVTWRGGLSYDLLSAVAGQIQATVHAQQFGGEPDNILKRRQDAKEEAQQKQEDYENAHPWICDHKHCTRRFKTERGARQHEARCWYRKKGE